MPPEFKEQLVVEIGVRNLDRSIELYTSLGVTFERRDGRFVVLRWGDRRLLLAQEADFPAPPKPSHANVRVLMPDVDRQWALATSLGFEVERPIGDRYYGLRDFTVLDAHGVGLRFASRL